MFFKKPKRRKLDQFLAEHRKDPEAALFEMTRLSNRVWRLLLGIVLTTVFLGLLMPVEDWRQTISLGVLVFLMNGLGWWALQQVRPRLFDRPARFNQFIALLLGTVCVTKAMYWLGWSPFLAPLPVLAMVLAMIYGQTVALLVSIGMGFYLSLMSQRLWDLESETIYEALASTLARMAAPESAVRVILDPVLARADFVLGVCLITGAMTSVIFVRHIRQQSVPTFVGVLAGLTQASVALAFRVADPSLDLSGGPGGFAWQRLDRVFIEPGWALAGGVFSGALVTVFLPGIEKLFGIVTERRLLALSDPNHELLRTLRNRAPGTYQHTLGVAQLCSAAAEAIGADALLAQVGAYYHDIGKMVKPEYFVENMGEDKSIHSRLRPSMSKLIIISHVKEGMELAIEAKLPPRIIDMIPMHHGTTVVEYFFHKAKERGAEAKTVETDTEYRYPGPRPRFREAGIIMLADAVEASAKSLTDPNTNRFRDLAREIIQKRLLDGQLDECALTIKDLRKIEDSFVRTLTTMYHGRIRYPSSDERPPGEAGGATAGKKEAGAAPDESGKSPGAEARAGDESEERLVRSGSTRPPSDS